MANVEDVVKNLESFDHDFGNYLESIIRPPSLPDRYHSSGRLWHYLNDRVTEHFREHHVANYVTERWHGVVHALMVGYWACKLQQNRTKNTDYLDNYYQHNEEHLDLIAQCLVHDMGRTVLDDQEIHVDWLRKLFTSLPDYVYNHSAPPIHEHVHPMVLADRLELYRFYHEDMFNGVIMDQFLPPGAAWSRDPNTLLGTVYKYVHPAMLELQEYRSKPWIRHGPEELQVIIDSCNNSEKDWDVKGEIVRNASPDAWPAEYWGVSGCFAAEIGTQPFRYPITSTYELSCGGYVRQKGKIGWTRPSGCLYPIGVTPLHHFRKVIRIKDHIGVNHNTKVADWVFLYDKPDDLLKPTFQESWSGKKIHSYIQCDEPVRLCSLHIANKLYETIETIRLALLGMCLNLRHGGS